MNDVTHNGFGGGSPARMSSKEVASLCEKDHKHVIRDIRTMLEALGDGPDLGHVEEAKDSRGYTLEFLLPRDLTMTLVSGYSVQLRHRIVTRLNQLEQRQPSPIDVRNLPQLQTIALQLIEVNKEQSEQIAAMVPKVEAMALLESSEGSVGPRVAAKLLNQPEKKFTAWLQAIHWAFRQNGIGPLQAYADKRDAGYLEHRPHTYYDQGRGEERTVAQLMITPKGLARLAQLLAKVPA